MTRSAKLGITSVVLLLIALVTPFINWQFPITFISGECLFFLHSWRLNKEAGGGSRFRVS
jgi:hypothetical protein